MLLTVTRRYHFESAHFLPLVPHGHKCKRLHGHNYVVEVTINGPVVDGWVIDFYDLDAVISPILGLVDHRLLNDVVGLENPTVETIGPWFLRQVQERFDKYHQDLHLTCFKVRVYETPDCYVDVWAQPA